MDVINAIETTRLVFTLVVSIVTAMVGAVLWTRRSVRAVAAEEVSDVATAQEASEEKIDALDDDMRRNARKIESLERQMGDVQNSLENMGSAMRTMPTRDDIHNLTLAMQRSEGNIERLDAKFEERLKPIASIMERMQELLMRGSKD
ncbi:hypothetical protein [Cognatiyoonia sp. IB215182]|uniref:hypothetical protein n=1 Tax=Cognatiyoonia sp. IB215182 TaxID=3097353 RepID=UPI002A17759E|nr:hypothetical protein [Cognatiyoonia sp. IB215182]MDX8354338.1 hypothetical protein [Cognatiyoonia sp. IB215182]